MDNNKKETPDTAKYEHFGYIGLFWYIDGEDIFIEEKFELSKEIQKSSLFITAPVSHPMLWEKYKNQYGGVKFTHYPRGRVNYQVPKDIFEIDADYCIQKNKSLVERIHETFLLDKGKTIIIPAGETNQNSLNYSNEGHYRCHLCGKKTD